jgi:hypothetical protein
LKEAAFFGDFLCSRKESYPPAGEAVTEKIGKIKAAARKPQQAKKNRKVLALPNPSPQP